MPSLLPGNFILHTYCDHMCMAKVFLWQSQGQYYLWSLSGPSNMGLRYLCIFFCLTLWSCEQWWVCHMQMFVTKTWAPADAPYKALSTCTSHTCATVIIYIPTLFTIFAHHFGRQNIFHLICIIIANVYFMLPPTLNHIACGVKTKQIKARLFKLFLKENGILAIKSIRELVSKNQRKTKNILEEILEYKFKTNWFYYREHYSLNTCYNITWDFFCRTHQW